MREEVIDKKDIETIKETITSSEVKPLSEGNLTTEEIAINLKEKVKEEKTRVNSRDNSFLKKIVETPKEQPGGGTSNSDDVKKRILSDTPSLGGSSSTADDGESESTSELIIELLDWILVEVITFYSMDKSSKDYETDNNKKKILKKYLAKFLIKKQTKYPVEFFLVAAFLSTYFISARKAHVARGVNVKLKEDLKKEQANKRDSERTERRKRRSKDEIENATIISEEKY